LVSCKHTDHVVSERASRRRPQRQANPQ
jgi:hypothetical protein